MKGIKRFSVIKKRYRYDIEVRRKISVIQGNSGIGKSKLFESIRSWNLDGGNGKSAIRISGYTNVIALDPSDYKTFELECNKYKDYIIIIDEDSEKDEFKLKSTEFARVINSSSNYFIIIYRESLNNLAYSYDSVYTMTTDRDNNITRLEQYYKGGYSSRLKIDTIITEDRKSGFQFFKQFENGNTIVDTSDGKDTIKDKVLEPKFIGRNILVVADGSAFGANIRDFIDIQKRIRSLIGYFPESFEWLLLHSSLFKSKLNFDIDDFYNNVDSTEVSAEQFYEKVITDLTQNTGAAYNKSKLKKCYTENCCPYKEECSLVLRDRSINKNKELLGLIHIDLSNFNIPL